MELSDHVTVIERQDRTFYLVGTAHISSESVDEVRRVIEEIQPDVVAIELCDTRYAALIDEKRWEKLDIFKVIREGKSLMLLANLAIGAYQRRLGQKLGVKPGAEMLEASKAANDVGARIALVDREIQITLKRTWANIGFWKKITLAGGLFESMFAGNGDEVDHDTIEQLKEQAQLSEMLEEFARVLPEVKEPLIDERDLFMVSKLRETTGDKVVVVVGAGHVPGMTRHFDDDIDRDALNATPEPKTWTRVVKWAIPMAVIAAFYIGVRKNDWSSADEMLMAWVLPNSVFAALGTLIAGAKLPSIAVAFLMSPITSLNPLLPVGVPVGLTEAWFRKPTVADAERIPDDVQTFKGFYRNAFTRTLLVIFMSIMGSAAGAWFGLGWLAKLVAS